MLPLLTVLQCNEGTPYTGPGPSVTQSLCSSSASLPSSQVNTSPPAPVLPPSLSSLLTSPCLPTLQEDSSELYK